MAERTLMKDGLDKAAIARISTALQKINPGFSQSRFRKRALQGLEKLELKERVAHVIETLHIHLPADFKVAARVLARVPQHWDRGKENDPLAGFAAWPIIDYVGVYGLGNARTSLRLLKKLTPLFSAELAIRHFILSDPDLTLEYLHKWCGDSNDHVRRLVSEGTRPRLPWAMRLPPFIKDPAPALELLEKLKDDSSLYVRRSVANNLNDISKDHPDLVLRVCRRWKKTSTPERRWIIRHATRTLVKEGKPEVFPLLGYTKDPQVSVTRLKVSSAKVSMGEALTFSIELVSRSATRQSFVLDYAIHFVKSNGKLSPKVFKLKSVKLSPGETATVESKFPFKTITTRKYYSGKHILELLINGVSLGKRTFRLTV